MQILQVIEIVTMEDKYIERFAIWALTGMGTLFLGFMGYLVRRQIGKSDKHIEDWMLQIEKRDERYMCKFDELFKLVNALGGDIIKVQAATDSIRESQKETKTELRDHIDRLEKRIIVLENKS